MMRTIRTIRAKRLAGRGGCSSDDFVAGKFPFPPGNFN